METALRILDANANRVREALRTMEDVVRFQFDDRVWSGVLKELRHDLAAAMSGFPLMDLLASRDTPGDVGTQISTPAEGVRSEPWAILVAACKRMQEALRSMEEQAKTPGLPTKLTGLAANYPAPGSMGQVPGTTGGRQGCRKAPGSGGKPAGGGVSVASRLEALRYRVYDLEAKLVGQFHRAGRFRLVRLYVLLTSGLCRKPWQDVAEAVLEAGADAVQLREKGDLTDRELLDRCGWLQQRCRDAGKLFIVNDRPDIAALAGADGVHLGQEDLTVTAARRIVGGSCLIGVSTHNLEQARQAVLAGADYLGVGPMFPTGTKPEAVGRWGLPGPELLRQATAEISLPLAAIGGITAENAASLRAAGGHCLAVSSAILSADDPARVVREIRRILEDGT